MRYLLLVGLVLAQPRLIYRDTLRQVYVYTLSNGLTVIVSPNPATPRAFVMVATRAGSKQDPPDNTGLAHYLEHLLFKGTDRYGTKDYDREKPYLDAIEALYETYHKTRDSVQRRAFTSRLTRCPSLRRNGPSPTSMTAWLAPSVPSALTLLPALK